MNRIKNLILKIIYFIIIYKLILFISLLFFPLPEILNNDFSTTYYYNDNTVAWISLNNNEQYRIYTQVNEVSLYLKKGIIEYEDKYFYYHPGVNFISIIKSFIMNIKAGRIVSGGSTITMQVARLAVPKKRTIKNKFIECLRALQIENCCSKNKILEMYLNIIPMGGNIQGAAAASYFYFGKNPYELTFAESSLLISISNSPASNRPDRYPQNALHARGKVAERIHKEFNISKKELQNILLQNIPGIKHDFKPDIIPLIQRFCDLPYKNKRILAIDKNLQSLCLGILKNKMELSETINGSVIVVENSTMNILAYIGSPFYEFDYDSVKYNSCYVYRSPGSTLKPFIYGKALEQGLISPKKVLFDIPQNFYGYKPENYTNKYMGPVFADEALIRSLNIPAVYLLNNMRGSAIKEVFKKAGYRDKAGSIENEDLSIALGSYPMTLENMVSLYSSLAHEGVMYDLKFFRGNNKNLTNGSGIMSKEAAYIISDILSNVYRPDLPISWEFTKDKPRVAYKTGTSYGFVDAWAIGYTPRYTIGVWIGNLNNKFTSALTGITTAAPVLFGIMNELERTNDSWFDKPENVGVRQVCAVSGMIPGKFCKKTVEELYIKEVSDNSVCNVHKRVIVEKKTGRVTPINEIEPGKQYEEKIVELWNENMEYYLKKMGKKNFKMHGNFDDLYNTGNLKIISPVKGVEYEIDPDCPQEYQKLALAALKLPDSGSFYWYANDKYIGKTNCDNPIYYLPEEKNIKFCVVDEKGRSGEIEIEVMF